MRVKVGDKLVCISNFIDVFMVGKTYVIVEISGHTLFLSDTIGDKYWFDIDNDERFYYGNYFKCLREERVRKLNRLSIISNGASSIDTRLQ